jgi:predicted dehydrogenase
MKEFGVSNDDKRTRVAMVGCGFYAQNHLHAWKHLSSQEADLAAVCDLVSAKAETAGKHFAAPWFTDVDKMLDAVPVDIVDIATRMNSHRQLAAKVADRGLAAIIQKPFAPKWDDCVAIVEYARSKGTWIAVHENFRFTSAMRRVKAVINSGAIGEPNWARISFRTGFDVYRGQPYLAREERLLILDVGVHVLDVARFLIGDVKHISCETQRRNPKITAEDTASMLLRHVSGAVSFVDATYEAHRIPDSFPETLLEIEGPEGSIMVIRGERMIVTTQGINFEESIGGPLLPWTSRPWHASQEAVLHTNAHMLASFRAGVEAETSGPDSLKTFALVEAAYESAATGTTVVPKAWQQNED